jgi:hypothetical protein
VETATVTMRPVNKNRELLQVKKTVPGRMFSEMATFTLSKSANSTDTDQAHSSQIHADFTGGIKWFPLISGSSSKQMLLESAQVFIFSQYLICLGIVLNCDIRTGQWLRCCCGCHF